MSLLQPAFLWSLAAAAVPLILHLSRHRKYRELPVGTLRFLQQAVKERRRRARIEELLLLLLRMAAIGLLAFLFMRPFVSSSRAEDEEKGSDTVILLDASGSVTPEMLEEGKDALEDALSEAGDGKVTVAQFSDAVEPLTDPAAWQPRHGAPTAVPVALDWALQHFLSRGRTAGRVVLIAHLPAEGLPNEPPRVWPPGIGVQLMPLVPPSPDNAAVLRTTLLTPYVAENMEIEATVSFPGGQKDRTVSLTAEGVAKQATVPPGTDRVVFRFRPTREVVRGKISVSGGDAWPADDARPFAVSWTEPRRILLVDGRPGSTPFEGQAYFISRALAASGAAHGKSAFNPEITYGLEAKNGLTDLTGVGAVVLCGVNDLTLGAVRALEEYVEAGGGLLVVPDETWTPGATADLMQSGLFPRAVEYSGGTEQRTLAQWDTAHPVLQAFDGKEGGDLRGLPWRDGFTMRPDDGWKVLASLDGGNPVLLERTAEGEGRVIVCAHPLTRGWTDLPREPLFAPLVKNLAAYLSRLEIRQESARVLVPGIREGRSIGDYTLPDGSPEVVAADSAESLVSAVSADAFRKAWGLPAPGAVAAAAEQGRARTEHGERRELWPWLILALLLLLAAENFFATRPLRTPVKSTN